MLGVKKSKFTELCGWYGMAALIVAYSLAGFAVIPADGILYLVLNISGAIGLIIVSAADRVEQSVLLNIFWVVIGVMALLRIWL